MRHFVELTFAGDETPMMIAVEDIQTFSPPPQNLSAAGVGTVISTAEMVIHVKETYTTVKQKIVNLVN
mgnify:CR=1 FL=1